MCAHTAACKTLESFEERNSFDMRRFILSAYTNHRFFRTFFSCGFDCYLFFTRAVFYESRFFLITIHNAFQFKCQCENIREKNTLANRHTRTKQLINYKPVPLFQQNLLFEESLIPTIKTHIIFGFGFHSKFLFGHYNLNRFFFVFFPKQHLSLQSTIIWLQWMRKISYCKMLHCSFDKKKQCTRRKKELRFEYVYCFKMTHIYIENAIWKKARSCICKWNRCTECVSCFTNTRFAVVLGCEWFAHFVEIDWVCEYGMSG